jgi:hypothetical protein
MEYQITQLPNGKALVTCRYPPGFKAPEEELGVQYESVDAAWNAIADGVAEALAS